MADRFPLIVNSTSKKIEELVAGDNLELTNNGIVVGGDTGNGKYLTSDGTNVFWGVPGDVYLDQTQTLTNKVFNNCTISGNLNTLTNIANSALVNSGITINGSTIPLGGSVVTPNDNTEYSMSAGDGSTDAIKTILITSSPGGTSTGINFAVAVASSVPSGENAINFALARSGDTITLTGTVQDNNTITRLQSASGGNLVSGDVTIAAGNFTTVSQVGQTITVSGQDTDTVTRVRATSGQSFASGDFTFLAGGAASVAQGQDANGDPTITYESVNTVTRVKGGGSGSLVSGDVTITGGSGGNTTVSQSGNTISIDSTDTNTVTKVAANSEVLGSGDFRILASGATSISTADNSGVTEITISSVNTDTGASASAAGGIVKAANEFSLKNNANFIGNTVMKWDSGNGQLTNSILEDDGTTLTVGGDLVVEGTQTIFNTSVLQVEDNIIELRKGNSLQAADGGIQVNLTADANGNIESYRQLQWFNSGGYWRSFDGSIDNRFVTENETQTLTNKTLTSPTMTNPDLGTASATTINGVTISSAASATLTIRDAKELNVQRDLLLTSDNNLQEITVNFRQGGNVAMTSDTLAVFNSTTSTQLRALISDTTGTAKLVFQDNPNILNGLTTTSSGLTIFNTQATSILAFSAASSITIGAATGTTLVNHDLEVTKSATLGTGISDDFVVNSTANFEKADILIRGTQTDPMSIGRGAGGVGTNTRIGVACLDNITSGSQNTAVGYKALITCNSGASNTAVGVRALSQNGVGTNNISVGRDSMLSNTSGDKNVAVGNNTLESNQAGEANVAIGHYAGYGVTGTGNVIIGPADNENSTNVTYQLDNPSGDRQLVIGSGTEAWIKGNSSFDVTINNGLTVDGDALIQGSLTVNGTVVSINSTTMQVDDKNLELAAVVNTTFSCITVDGSSTITSITPTAGLIPGMEVNSTTGGISVPGGTTIVSLNGNQALLSNSVTGSGTATIVAQGPADLAANGGGIILKGTDQSLGGTGDKTILYDHTRTDKYWTFSENLEIAFGKKFVIGNQLALSATALGSTVVDSSLTSVGVLVGPAGSPALEVNGAAVLGGRILEKSFSSFNSGFTINSNVLNVTAAAANTICGNTASNTAINEWSFNTADPDGNVLANNQSLTLTLIIDASTASTYGDACSVDGNSITNGVEWSGGSPPIATSNTDILTFVIIKDGSGVIRVFGQGNTDFS
tara:strand:- start:6365 stop:9985 length:3621 start_codon:yes stop_codon:yes gene_type:complete